MIGYLRTCVRKQPIIALYFEFETFSSFITRGLVILLNNQSEEIDENLTSVFGSRMGGGGGGGGQISPLMHIALWLDLVQQ